MSDLYFFKDDDLIHKAKTKPWKKPAAPRPQDAFTQVYTNVDCNEFEDHELPALVGTGMVFAPMVCAQERKPAPMSDDMKRAIAWERFKDLAAARQARMEATHPSVTYTDANRSADRSMDDSNQGKPVKDPGPTVRKDK